MKQSKPRDPANLQKLFEFSGGLAALLYLFYSSKNKNPLGERESTF
jgi:hypothetical protein